MDREYRRQHTIPQYYLAAFADPQANRRTPTRLGDLKGRELEDASLLFGRRACTERLIFLISLGYLMSQVILNRTALL